MNEFRKKLPSFSKVNNHLNHLSFLQKALDDNCKAVIRSHEQKILEIILNSKQPYTFVYRSPAESLHSALRHDDYLLSKGKLPFNGIRNICQVVNTFIKYKSVCNLVGVPRDSRCFPYEALANDPLATIRSALECNGINVCLDTLSSIVASFDRNTADKEKLAKMKSSFVYCKRKFIKPSKLQKNYCFKVK